MYRSGKTVVMEHSGALKLFGKLLSRAKEVYKEKGVHYVIRFGARIAIGIITNPFCYYYYRIFKSSRTFTFRGEKHSYFYHRYNTTWGNERAVEIPIVWRILKKYPRKRILEVGNVFSHYFPVDHDVLDKYEKADNVIMQDIVDFQPSEKYDLIVSISTLEHVGWDEDPREPAKVLNAIENLKRCLAAGGKIVATLPLGLNLEMDKLLRNGKLQFTKQYYLKKISKRNIWIESDWENVQNAKYNYPFRWASGLIIGIIER